MSEPEVIDGPRSVSNSEPTPASSKRKPRQRITAVDEPKPSFPTRFQSVAGNLILTLNHRTPLPDGKVLDNKFNVRFERGFVDITQGRYPVALEIVSKLITKGEGYGLGRGYWDADAFAEKEQTDATEAFLAQAREFAASDPKLRERLQATLSDDFDLPPADPKAE